jgi:hypothetical protein
MIRRAYPSNLIAARRWTLWFKIQENGSFALYANPDNTNRTDKQLQPSILIYTGILRKPDIANRTIPHIDKADGNPPPFLYAKKKKRVNTIEWIGKARMASTQGWLKPLRLRITQTSLPLAGSYLLEVLTIKARGNGVKVKYYTTALTRILTAGIQWYEELILQTSLQQGVSFTWTNRCWFCVKRNPDKSNRTTQNQNISEWEGGAQPG